MKEYCIYVHLWDTKRQILSTVQAVGFMYLINNINNLLIHQNFINKINAKRDKIMSEPIIQ
jgi:hypothetical protein